MSVDIFDFMQNRNGYGCDIMREYVNIAWERLHKYRAGTLRTRPMDRPIYEPNS